MLKVMIVDNEAAVRKGLCHCVHWEGLGCYIAAQAEDGLDALAQIKDVAPDILISDIKMPEMDGLELAFLLHRDYPHLKVIILTGFPDFEYAKRAIACQIVDFVLKPTSAESLTKAIEKAKEMIAQEDIGKKLRFDLEQQEQENLKLQRRMLIQELIQDAGISQLSLLNRMSQLRLNLCGYFVLRMDICSRKDDIPDLPEDDLTLLSYLKQAQNILLECLPNSRLHFVSRGDQSCYAVLETQRNLPISKNCAETVQILESFMPALLCIGISGFCTDPLQMSEAAVQADQALQFARYTGEAPVMSFEQLPEVPADAMKLIYDDLRLLKSAVENQNAEKSAAILSSLFSNIRLHKLPMETVQNICLHIHQFCTELLYMPEAQSYPREDCIPSLKHWIGRETIDDLEKSMLDFAAQIMEQTPRYGKEVEELIDKLILYIKKHYSQNLSLDSLAENVHLSPGYLSRLFKREVGDNLSTYIQTVRIEEAKLLLKTTELKTYEVGERVGIPDPVYFSRIFKKVTGTKPKDYRQSD